MKKKLIFSRHVLERMIQRNVSEGVVRETIENPDHELPIQPDHTQEFKKTINSEECYVVVEHRKNALKIITAGWRNG